MEFRRLKDYQIHDCTKNFSLINTLGEFACGPDQAENNQVLLEQPVQTPEVQQEYSVQSQQVQREYPGPTEQVQQVQQVQSLEDPNHMTSSFTGKEAVQKVDWSQKMVKLLLVVFKDCRDQFQNRPVFTKNDIYREVSKILGTHGHNVQFTQVKSKLQLLEKSYKKKMENKGPTQSGRGTMTIQNETYVYYLNCLCMTPHFLPYCICTSIFIILTLQRIARSIW